MPAMTALEFADTIVVPTVEEFMRDPTQRRGYLACLAVYHLGDYLKKATEKFATDVHKKLEDDLGLPFLALQSMADAVKHREKRQGSKPGVILMESGSDTARPPTGWGRSSPGNPMRFADGGGGRWIENDGRRYDILDLCVIVLRAYARLYPGELAGSSIDRVHFNPGTYPRA